MMKTRRRVKRTVREMPRRLTIRLSKGSSRNMVEDPGKANATLLRNKARPSDGPLRQHQPRKESKLHSKFTSLNGLNRKLGSRVAVKRATGCSPKTSDLSGIDGLWR